MLFTILSAIVDFSKVYPTLSIILITLLPVTELRASIPYGILALNFPWYYVFIIAVITNIILGLVLYLIIGKIIWLFTKIKWVDRLYNKYVEKNILCSEKNGLNLQWFLNLNGIGNGA